MTPTEQHGRLLLETDRRQTTILVCEPGNRWTNVAKRFFGPDEDSAPASAVKICPIEHSKVRSAITGLRRVAILWDVNVENMASVALTISQVGVARPDVLQLAAVQAGASGPTRILALRLRELGVAATYQSPEQFAPIARLIRRRFEEQISTDFPFAG